MKTITGNLILKEDTKINESLKVEGDIISENRKFNLIVAGNIDAWDIVARNIDARNIDAGNIVFCEKINRETLKGEIKAKILVENRSELKQKNWK